jgi:lipopolysaccharide transport system ATP-binding protein
VNAAIVVDGLSKRFRRYHPERPVTFQEALRSGLRRLGPTDYFWVLRDLAFHVKTGTMVGLIGPNGAGKSTLLRLIGGVGTPDKGQVRVQGRVGALLDLGAGFHPDLTGRENIFISGVISGLTRQEIRTRFDAMVAFAELEAFIDSPLRTYSSGMQMRLAFAVAAHIEPEVLLIDEVLAVGDLGFQTKCLNRIAEFKRQGCTIVLVSHELTFVRDLCDEVLWLRGGELVAQGDAATVTDAYVAEMMAIR